VLLRGHWPDTRNLVADWYNFAFYLTCLLYGFGLAVDGSGWAAMERHRWGYLALGVASFSLIYWGWHAPGTGFLETSAAGVLTFSFFKCLNIWSWVLCFIGFGRRYLQRSNAFLRYTNQAVYPFYILHQTVLLLLAYYVVRWPTGIGGKYVVLVAGTFAGTVLLYDLVVRRVAFLRPLFGLEPAAPPSSP